MAVAGEAGAGRLEGRGEAAPAEGVGEEGGAEEGEEGLPLAEELPLEVGEALSLASKGLASVARRGEKKPCLTASKARLPLLELLLLPFLSRLPSSPPHSSVPIVGSHLVGTLASLSTGLGSSFRPSAPSLTLRLSRRACKRILGADCLRCSQRMATIAAAVAG